MKASVAALKKMRVEYEACHLAKLESRLAFNRAHRSEEEINA